MPLSFILFPFSSFGSIINVLTDPATALSFLSIKYPTLYLLGDPGSIIIVYFSSKYVEDK